MGAGPVLLCQLGGSLEGSVDASGEVSFGGSDGFSAGLAFGASALDVGGGFAAEADLGDDRRVEDPVEGPVAMPVEPVALLTSRGGVEWRGAGVAGERAVGGEAPDVTDLSDDGRGADRSDPWDLAERLACLAAESVDSGCELTDLFEPLTRRGGRRTNHLGPVRGCLMVCVRGRVATRWEDTDEQGRFGA